MVGSFRRENTVNWWCSIGVNIGNEQDGKNDEFERPVLVFKKLNKYMFIGIPQTTKIKEGKYFHCYKNDGTRYTFILSQIRLFSSKRLLRKVGRLDLNNYNEVKIRLIKILI